MAKVDIDLVKFILQRNNLDIRQVNSIIEDIEEEVKMQKEENPPVPRVTKQYAILVSDPEGTLPDKDLVGWVVQLPEEDPVASVESSIHKAAYDFNATPKGRRMPVETIGEACEVVPARIFKEHNIWVKTKEPVLVLRTDNAIPTLPDGLPE